MCVWRIAHGLRAEDPAVAPAVRAALGTARGGGVDVLASVKPPVPRARAVVVCMRLRPARARRLLPAVAVVAKRIDGLAGGGGGGGLGSLDRLRPTLLSQATTLAVSAGEHDCQHHRQKPANPHAQRRQESALPRGAARKRGAPNISFPASCQPSATGNGAGTPSRTVRG